MAIDFPPPVVELVERAKATAADILADRLGELLRGIRAIGDRQLVCGQAPLCVGDLIYYDKRSVDELVALNAPLSQEFARRGRRDAAAAAVAGIRLATRYDGAKLVPARVRLYPAAEVDAKLDAALRLLSAPASAP